MRAEDKRISGRMHQDQQLIKLVQTGNHQAFTELMEVYEGAVFHFILKRINNKKDAEDLTIEVFEKVFHHSTQYSTEYAFSTWIFSIAYNCCIDFLRRQKGVYVSLDQEDSVWEEWSLKLQASELGPEEDLIRKQKGEALRKAIEKLRPQYREIIYLRYFREFSYEEIAHHMNIPLGTVKTNLYRAREILSQSLE